MIGRHTSLPPSRAHLRQVGGGGRIPLRAAGATRRTALLHRDPAAQRHRFAAYGHALNNTLQDVLVRFERMRGRDVLWQPGTDHAGIATQMVVERQLMERQEPPRRLLGREKFLERVWAWKAEAAAPSPSSSSGSRLLRLVARTLHHGRGALARVRKVFVELYRAGLIYKDKRWSIGIRSSLPPSPISKCSRSSEGHLWHIRYPLEGAAFDANDPSTFITVATRGRRRCSRRGGRGASRR